MTASSGGPRWFSTNPSKAWGERFFLAYSPVWMTIVAALMAFGVTKRLGEWGFLSIAVAVAAPLVVVPALVRDETPLGRRWYQTYWFKANLYVGIFTFAANYFGTEYFFDVLGMVYDYPMVDLTLDATLVGSGDQRVPIMMYLLTQAYFITYHTTAVVVLRRLRTSKLAAGALLWPIVLAVVAYAWAWLETKTMANPWIQEQYHYKDLEHMLTYGALFYSLYFLASFPIFYHLDEGLATCWSPIETAGAALSASMIMLVLLDLAASFFPAVT